jgi:hypothetical protein
MCPGSDTVPDDADLALGNGIGGQELAAKQA